MKEPKIRCAFISSYMGPYYGNYVASVISCERAIQARGYSSVYIFPKDVASYSWVEKLRQVNQNLYFLDYAPKSIKNVIALWRIFKKNRINLIYSRMCGWDITARAAAPCTPIVWHMEMGVNLSVRRKRIKNWLKFRILALGPVYHVAASVPVAEAINSLHPRHKCVANPNSLDFSRLRPKAASFKPRNVPLKLLTFGYDPKTKGLDVALDACELLNRESVRFQLLVSAQQKTCSYVKERYTVQPDWLTLLPPTDDIAALYEESDIMLLPSRSEGFSYCLAEAIYSGLPVICSDIQANEWASELKNTFFFRSEDPTSLAETIELCAQQPVEKSDCDFNRSLLQEKYSLEAWTKLSLQVIESIRG